MLTTGEYQQRAAALGAVLGYELDQLIGRGVMGARVRGLWAGIDVDPSLGGARRVCEALLHRGVLAKEAHGSTLRLAPPLVIEEPEVRWAIAQLADALASLCR